MTKKQKFERIYALDALRAVMMLLGLVLHSAITYGSINYGELWYLKDHRSTHFTMDFILQFIHVFRMPIFFIISGFFSAFLLHHKSIKTLIQNRLKRIVYPFIVFLFLLWPLIIFSFKFTEFSFEGSENALLQTLYIFTNPLFVIPQMSFHLWFLYYLIFFNIIGLGLTLIFQKTTKANRIFYTLFNRILKSSFLRILIFPSLTFLLFILIKPDDFQSNTSFILNLKSFSIYLLLYLFGWILFQARNLLFRLKKTCSTCCLLGLSLFIIYFNF